MTYKDWIIPKLKKLEEQRSSLARIPEEIKTLELEAVDIKATSFDKDPVQSSHGNSAEEKLLANIAEKQDLERKFEITSREVKELESALAELTADEQTVLEEMYIRRGKCNRDALCERLYIEKSKLYKIKDKALISLARRMLGQVEL